MQTLTDSEKDQIMEIFNERFKEAKGTKRDKVWNQIEGIATDETRNRLWENNHETITCFIANHIQEYGRIPSVGHIAANSNLSRQTVHKHLKEYTNNPLYIEQQEQLRFMTSKVLAKVYEFAVNGDVGAARLYFNVMGCLNSGQASNNTLIQNQQNNIQINNTVLNQETVKYLNAEQLNEIETILRTALPINVNN
jgi:SOS-response transcriptional repressor LexA